MIKAWCFHKGYFHLLVLEGDAIAYCECPSAWFEQAPEADGKIGVKLTWPPPFMPKRAPTPALGSVAIDRGTGADSITVTQI